jgi:hypothetical protein
VIRNDVELEVVRKQLHRAEAALDACRRDFLPHNEVQYHLFAGSTIDLIRSIRADIDAYLGIGPDTDLSFSLEGESVSLGNTSAGWITRTINTFRRSLQSVIGVLHADAGMVRRRAGWIERLCDLSLVGVGPGSVQVHLDLPGNIDGSSQKEERRLLADALTVLFDGLEWAAREDEPVPASLERLPPSQRLSVLGVVSRLLPPQTGPVQRIAYRQRGEGPTRPPRRATLTRESRQRVHREMERLAARSRFTEVEGVIRQVDLDAQTFVLRERPDRQPDLPCEYPDALAETVKEFLDCRVQVSGFVETSRLTHRSKLEAEAIESLADEEVKPPAGRAPHLLGSDQDEPAHSS